MTSRNSRPRTVLIIQARMGSTRLPGKSLMDLAGESLVSRILERVIRCKSFDEIVLAIPDTKQDRLLREIGKDYGVTVYAGSENDLVERYYQAARESRAEIVARLPADNATPEPAEIDRIVEYHLELNRRGFSSNLAEIDNSGYPDGIGAEVFDFSLLEEVRDSQHDAFKREHVHLNFYDYERGTAVDSSWCPVSTIACPSAFKRPDIVLDVNTDAQYQFMKALYEALYPKNPNFGILEIIDWYDREYSVGKK